MSCFLQYKMLDIWIKKWNSSSISLWLYKSHFLILIDGLSYLPISIFKSWEDSLKRVNHFSIFCMDIVVHMKTKIYQLIVYINNINNNFTVRQTAKCCYIVICPEKIWLGGKGTIQRRIKWTVPKPLLTISHQADSALHKLHSERSVFTPSGERLCFLV